MKNHLCQMKRRAEAAYARKFQPDAEISLNSCQEHKWPFSDQCGFKEKIQSRKQSCS